MANTSILNAFERMWQHITTALNNKVDKVSGKGLSTNDYTTTEKNKLAGVAEGANKIVVDTALSSSSTNPVQNKVVNSAISALQTKVGSDYIFDKFPTEAEINALPNWAYFTTRGFHYKNDGLGATYQVKNSTGAFYIPYGNMYFRPIVTDWATKDIYVDLYGVRRLDSSDTTNMPTVSARNSEIMSALVSSLKNGFTFHFGSGHYYFAQPIPHIDYHVTIKGVASNANPISDNMNYGTHLHFPNLANGQAAISIAGGVVQDIAVIGNPSVCNVAFDRTKTHTDPNGVVTLVDTGTTYGVKAGSWGFTIQNVRVINCTYGIYGTVCNYLITNSCAKKCKVGISVENDGRISDIQLTDVITGIELRGQLVSVNNVRGDSIGKHLIECWRGKCMLSNIDGDYCMGSLIHYGGNLKYIHLGQATTCMGRVAAKNTYSRGTTFDLRNVPAEDYEYCSYFSIAPNTSVFGGQLDVTNVNANVYDTTSNYVHPNSIISIGTGSTVKGLIVKCNIPDGADAEYFNRNVIKNLSSYAEANNDAKDYVTDFDGNIIEDIGFVTPTGFARSKRTLADPDRQVEILDSGISVISDMIVGVGISIPSINFNDNVWEDGYFNASGADYVGSYSGQCFRNKNYIPVEGGRTMAIYYDSHIWNGNNKGLKFYYIQYDANKNVIGERAQIGTYTGNETLTLASNAAYIRFGYNKWATIPCALTEILIAYYYLEDARKEYVSHEPTIIGERKLSLEEAVIPSSTEGSTKKFRLTVNDSGVISAVEIT